MELTHDRLATKPQSLVAWPIGSKVVAKIAAGAQPALTDLTLDRPTIIHNGDPTVHTTTFEARELLPALVRLTRLRLARAYVAGSAGLRPLRGAVLGRLVELRGSFAFVEGEALADLLSASLPALRKLWLCCHSSRRRPPAEVAAAATALAAAPWAAALEELTLICRLQDAGMAARAAVGFTSLRRLALMETATTGATLAALAASPAVVAGHLTHLSIGSCDPSLGATSPRGRHSRRPHCRCCARSASLSRPAALGKGATCWRARRGCHSCGRVH